MDYETLKKLSRLRVDLIIFFPDHLDVLRNWETYYFDNPDSNLDRCLGEGSPWREKLHQAPHDRRVEVLRTLYEQQLKNLGYSEFEFERINMAQGQPLYCLIFCSRNKKGAEIWRGISQKKPDGQRTFDFD